MSTDRELIEQAQRDVKPRDIIMHTVQLEGHRVVPLDCGSLKRLVELQVRKLNWEEWLDVREAWCRCFRAGYVACVRGDTLAMRLAAQQAERQGLQYLLLEYV